MNTPLDKPVAGTATPEAAAQAKSKAIAFTQPAQIEKILTEVCQLKIDLLMRMPNAAKSVRGVAEIYNSSDKGLVIGGISPAGDDLLRTIDVVRVEFVLLSTKLTFDTRIRARTNGKIILQCPTKMLSIERRLNSRFKVPTSHAAFVEFPDSRMDIARFDSPLIPRFMMQERLLVPKLRVDDVSLGGFACFTRYASVAQLFRASDLVLNGVVSFPNMAPLQVPIMMRWIKKTTTSIDAHRYPNLRRVVASRIKSQNELSLREVYYRIGLQFAEVPQELDAALRAFVYAVQTAESV